MTNILRVALVDPRDESRENLKSLLVGMEIVWLEAECSRYEYFQDVISQTNLDVGIVCLDANPDKAIALIERIRVSSPDCALLAMSSSTDGPLVIRTIRAGAKEFLTLPSNFEEMMQAMTRIQEMKFGSGDSRIRTSKMIAVAGATGGVGCTSIAVNIGCNLASNPENSVALVDLDLALGDADVFLDSIPDCTLLDVTENVSRLDFQLLRKSLTKHSSGLYLLPRPVQLQELTAINPESIRRVIGFLRASFTHVVFDISKSFSEVDLTAMELVDEVALIVQLDLPCLRNMVRLLMSFQEMDEIRDKVKVVVNRMGLESGQISLKKARETIGRDVFYQIPNDYRTMIEMRNNGVPLIEQAPKAAITQSIMQLTDMLVGNPSSVGDSESPEGSKPVAGAAGWLNFWQGKLQAKAKAPAK
jgi:pilus assembly protein CpaE